MSELKEHLFAPYSELQEGDELTDAITIAKSYYLKSEADKVIEELKHQRDGAFGLTNSGLTLDDISQMARKQLDHQKYKRCLAMAKWCEATALWCYQAANTLPVGFHATLYGKPVMIEPNRFSSGLHFSPSGVLGGLNLPRNLNLTQPPNRAKDNKMDNAQEVSISKTFRPIPRNSSDVVCELSYERREVACNLEKLNKAIEANPEAVSAHHKELWHKQAKAMQEYVDVLGERIKDLIDNG